MRLLVILGSYVSWSLSELKALPVSELVEWLEVAQEAHRDDG